MEPHSATLASHGPALVCVTAPALSEMHRPGATGRAIVGRWCSSAACAADAVEEIEEEALDCEGTARSIGTAWKRKAREQEAGSRGGGSESDALFHAAALLYSRTDGIDIEGAEESQRRSEHSRGDLQQQEKGG